MPNPPERQPAELLSVPNDPRESSSSTNYEAIPITPERFRLFCKFAGIELTADDLRMASAAWQKIYSAVRDLRSIPLNYLDPSEPRTAERWIEDAVQRSLAATEDSG